MSPVRCFVAKSAAAMAVLASVPAWGAHHDDPATMCQRTMRLPIDREVMIESATLVDAVASGSNAAPAYCDVRGTIRGNIKFAVWLPQADWNGRFQMVGNGGKAGSISFDAMRSALRLGYATSSTDTGHDASVQAEGGARFGNEALFGKEREVDFGWRAVHLTAAASKKVVFRHYGAAPDYSYWNGCSTGGRQGLMEVQRFPEDFDGYLVGAAVSPYTGQQMSAPAYLRSLYKKIPPSSPADGPFLSAAKRDLLGRIIYDGNGTSFAGCDAADGLKDGQIRDPLSCGFNVDQHLPACEPGQADTNACFTEAEKAAVRPIYQGQEPHVPGLPVGGENVPGSWSSWIVTNSPTGTPTLHSIMVDAFEWLMFTPDRPGFNYLTQFDWAVDPYLMDDARHTYDAVDPDLKVQARRGRKILMYHGQVDAASNFLRSIRYRQSVIDRFQQDRPRHSHRPSAEHAVDDFLKLYLVPGMGHCGGGVGHSNVDWLSPLVDWVENRRAPAAIVGTKPGTTSTRPHCPYPQVAVYDGHGDPTVAASFACRAPGR